MRIGLRWIAVLATSLFLAAIGLRWLRPPPASVRLVRGGTEVDARIAGRAVPGRRLPDDVDEIGRQLPDLLRSELGREDALLFYPSFAQAEFDPSHPVLFRMPPHVTRRIRWKEHPKGSFVMRFNDLGLHEDADVRREGVDLRVLLQGDSHMAGLCSNAENAANILERQLCAASGRVVDVLNVSQGGTDPILYMGTLSAYRDLDPDAIVIVLYGGNDFYSLCPLASFLFRVAIEGWSGKPVDVPDPVPERVGKMIAQELGQVLYFYLRPRQIEIAERLACAALAELQRQCLEAGVELLVAYLPPPSVGAAAAHRRNMQAQLEDFSVEPEALDVPARIARGVLAFLRDRGIRVVDLESALSRRPRRAYWEEDLHLSAWGHAAVAAELEPILRATLGL